MCLLTTAATERTAHYPGHSDPALDGWTELRDLGKMMGQVAGVGVGAEKGGEQWKAAGWEESLEKSRQQMRRTSD